MITTIIINALIMPRVELQSRVILNLYIKLGRISMYKRLSLPNNDYGMSFYLFKVFLFLVTNVLWLLTGFSSSCKFILAFLVYTYNCVVLWILHWTGCSIFPKCFPRWLDYLTFPPIVYERPPHTYQDQEWSVFDFSNSNRCVMASHCDFNLHLHND